MVPLLYGTLIFVREDVLLQLGKISCPVVWPAERPSVVSWHVNVNAANDQRAGSNLQSHQSNLSLDLLVSGFREGQSSPIKVAKGWQMKTPSRTQSHQKIKKPRDFRFYRNWSNPVAPIVQSLDLLVSGFRERQSSPIKVAKGWQMKTSGWTGFESFGFEFAESFPNIPSCRHLT